MDGKKDRIRNYAFRRFIASGYSAVTIEEIARGCGVGKATVYKYFSSKEDLIFSCIDSFTEQIRSEMAGICSAADLSPAKKLSKYVKPVARAVSHANAAALEDIRRNVPEAYRKIQSNRREILFSAITKILEEGKAEGLIRPDIDNQVVAHLMIGAVTRLTDPPVMMSVNLAPDQILNMLVSIVVQGCLTDAGRAAAGRDA